MFTTETGDPIDPATFRRAFRAPIETAGIPAKQPTASCPSPGRWHPHEMRHSAASYMDHAGVPRSRIAEILGHEGTRTTEVVYIQPEIVDMTGAEFEAEFEAYGNQFGNQDPGEEALTMIQMRPDLRELCGAMEIRTPDLLHAISRQHVHRSPSPQVTVPGRALVRALVRSGCCTSVLCSLQAVAVPRPGRQRLAAAP